MLQRTGQNAGVCPLASYNVSRLLNLPGALAARSAAAPVCTPAARLVLVGPRDRFSSAREIASLPQSSARLKEVVRSFSEACARGLSGRAQVEGKEAIKQRGTSIPALHALPLAFEYGLRLRNDTICRGDKLLAAIAGIVE